MEKKSLEELQEFQQGKFTKRVVFKGEDHALFVLNFGPGTELPAHNHPGAHVYILVIEGSGTVTSNGEETPVSKGDAVHIAGDEVFSYRSKEESPSSLYVVLTKIPDERYAANISSQSFE
ncbi:cupin domain-containing protein [Paenibacillus caui]|uniref:cupin domain-containing protein n=1 Tax=Paenibacillus caui TaxID=2873927 RepID=UPI001CA92104|nr:cupin domain-containing protein [Paenibacillus caui]